MVRKLASQNNYGPLTEEERYDRDKDAGYVPTRDEVKAYEAMLYAPKKFNKRDLYHHDKDTKSKIKKLLKEVKSTKIIKPKNGTENISMIMNMVGDISKTPKHKKIDTEGIKHQIEEVEKLLKASPKALKKLVKADKEHLKYHPSEMDKKELKLDTKIMKQSKDYKHKVKNVSSAVRNYVDYYIDIYKNSKTPQSRSKKLNALKIKLYTNLRPSDADDANTLIKEFNKTLEPIVKAKGTTKKSSVHDKKYKSVTEYVKKNKPSIKDVDDIHIIVTELIGKDKRMSKKLLDEVFKDLEITGSGLSKRKMKGRALNGDEGDEGETDEEIFDQDLDPDDVENPSHPILEHENDIHDIEQSIDVLTSKDIVTESEVREFIELQKTEPKELIRAYNRINKSPAIQEQIRLGNDTPFSKELNPNHTYLGNIGIINNKLLNSRPYGRKGGKMVKGLLEVYKLMKKSKPKIYDNPTKDLKKFKDDRNDDDDSRHPKLLRVY